MELPPSLSPLPSKSWYSDNAGVEEVIGAGTVGVVKVLEDMSVNSCFNLVLDIIHQCRQRIQTLVAMLVQGGCVAQ